jgi:hypothetical protein
MIRMNYRDFDDYLAPIAGGEGPLGFPDLKKDYDR